MLLLLLRLQVVAVPEGNMSERCLVEQRKLLYTLNTRLFEIKVCVGERFGGDTKVWWLHAAFAPAHPRRYGVLSSWGAPPTLHPPR